ncbi:MAG: Uma2 family endonuclease [Cyanobacteria bacterium J06643_5]
MTQTINQTVTFEEFVQWKPENKNYELHDGVIIEVAQPIGKHENVTGFLARKITVEFDRLDLPYFIAPKVLVKPEGKDSAYSPDVLVLDKRNLKNESLYEKESTVSQSASIPLVIEVVSTNWHDDYALKFGDYETIGISEYLIVDYLGLGGRQFIGNPKLPTITVCQLENEEYKRSLYRSDEVIQLKSFPELKLTANQVFQSATTS